MVETNVEKIVKSLNDLTQAMPLVEVYTRVNNVVVEINRQLTRDKHDERIEVEYKNKITSGYVVKQVKKSAKNNDSESIE